MTRRAPLIGYLVLLAAVIFVFGQQIHVVDDLRLSAIEGCERNNSLREIMRDQVEERLAQRQRLTQAGDYERFFPDIPPDELRSLLREQDKADHVALQRLAPVDCEVAYADSD